MRLHSSQESEWRSKYEKVCEQLRETKGQMTMDREGTFMENSRLKVRGCGMV